jgi:arylsulfatase
MDCLHGRAVPDRLADAGRDSARAATANAEHPRHHGDDVGWFNIGAYHRGMMADKRPNLDKLAAEGMMFTDYYAEASCTAGRAAFITGQLPIRT